MDLTPKWAKPLAILGIELQIAMLEADGRVRAEVLARAREQLEVLRGLG